MKNLFKIYGLIALIPLLTTNVYGVENDDLLTCLTIEHINGTQSHYWLTDSPQFTFEGDLLLLKSKKAEAEFKRSELQSFYFTKQTTAINTVTGTATEYTVRFEGNTLKISGLKADHIDIYDINGLHITTVNTSDQSAEFSLDKFPSGVYLLNIPGKPTLKIKK